ncbi:MAG: carbamoyl transferase [Deltaproteobacteria bacterium]|nr:carbamoyl transferase [Deltaproteobacteria bacterium]HCH63834.1 carbamoyl transferase [Deltaproteobacteria bacterium]
MATWILGMSALFHDAAVALVRDGEVVAAAQEERFTRIKHDAELPVRAAEWALAEAGIDATELDHLVFYEKPLAKFQRILVNSVAEFPRAWRSFPRAMQTWLGRKLWIAGEISRTFRVPPHKLLFSEHHLSHAASAFLPSPFDEAAILTIDGVGEATTTAIWRGNRTAPHVEPVAEVVFPHSLGLFYSAMTAFLGFAVNEGEYKVMGMAAFGRPRFMEQMRALVRLREHGSFELDLDAFCWHWHPSESFTGKLVSILGEPRFPGAPFDPTTPEGQHWADIAASTQAMLEEAVLHVARYARERVDLPNLCLAGGVGLNAVANTRLAVEGPFDQLWVQPAAGDAGGALGAALWCWHDLLEHPRVLNQRYRCDLGRRWTDAESAEILQDLRAPREQLSPQQRLNRAVDDLTTGGVIGWFQGCAEYGPRALGHRSILADPRGAGTRDRVNARIKYREAFRPFAPAVTAEAADRYFDLHTALTGPVQYMVATGTVRPEYREELAAITHIDGSARVQVVHPEHSPLFHSLLEAFGERTGMPVLLNTSFNLKGDPMVDTPIDAVAALYSSDLDAVYVGCHRVTRSERIRGGDLRD